MAILYFHSCQHSGRLSELEKEMNINNAMMEVLYSTITGRHYRWATVNCESVVKFKLKKASGGNQLIKEMHTIEHQVITPICYLAFRVIHTHITKQWNEIFYMLIHYNVFHSYLLINNA